ncbi:MAG: hypothetical protein AAGF15_10480 [Pseudomonadota bacterium]
MFNSAAGTKRALIFLVAALALGIYTLAASPKAARAEENWETKFRSQLSQLCEAESTNTEECRCVIRGFSRSTNVKEKQFMVRLFDMAKNGGNPQDLLDAMKLTGNDFTELSMRLSKIGANVKSQCAGAGS